MWTPSHWEFVVVLTVAFMTMVVVEVAVVAVLVAVLPVNMRCRGGAH